MSTVQVRQIWTHTAKDRLRRVRVMFIGDAPFATVRNMATGRLTRIALSHFNPKHHWRLSYQPPKPRNLVAPEAQTL